MEMNSYEIDRLLYQKQIRLYQRIDDLINNQFEKFDPDMLNVLTGTLMDLDDKVQLYKRGIQNGELFGVSYHNNRKQRKLEGLSLLEMLICLKRKTPNTIQ
jgi:HD-GYP domain-containing protein (c-di-GMP phosphodiesterase class II)